MNVPALDDAPSERTAQLMLKRASSSVNSSRTANVLFAVLALIAIGLAVVAVPLRIANA